MLRAILNLVSPWKARFEEVRLKRRWDDLRARGMHIGQGVNLPASTWIDADVCFLISIGDWCGFGEQCLILAHDAQMDEFLDAGLIAKVTIHESCHFGSRTVILPGVEVGPRTFVGANSVVAKSLPPETVCAGSPAKVICPLDEYLARHADEMSRNKTFPWAQYIANPTPERIAEMRAAVEHGPAYITGGFSEEIKGGGGTARTPHDHTALPTGIDYWKSRQGTKAR
jgi:maltose O-acetyltransferase